MAPGDEAQMRLDIANTDAPDGDYALSRRTTGSDRRPAAPAMLPDTVISPRAASGRP
jgi:hypothetical protein